MKRGLYRANAVVLNSFDYGESDRILSFYTLEHGLLKGIAKGARRSKRRFVGNLDPASSIKLVFFHSEKSELVRIEEASLVDGFNNIKKDIDTLSHACYLLELVSEMTREGQVLPQVYRLLAGFLTMLDEGSTPELMARFFEIRLLSMLGYMPHLGGCVVCKSALNGNDGLEQVKRFSSERGGLVCRRCAAGLMGLVPVSGGTIGFLSAAMKFDADKLTRLKATPAFLDESERLLYDFIKFHLGKELKTRRFMEKMKRASGSL